MSTLVNVVLSANAPGLASMDHFVTSYSGKSLFQLCIERNAPFSDRQIVVGHNEFHLQAKANLKAIGNRTYLSIIEEEHLTNLYSVAFAAFSATGDEVLLVTPSHYVISNGVAYKKVIEQMITIAEEEAIAALVFQADQGLELMPFFECRADKIIAVEIPADNKQYRALSRSKKHFAHSGIICCKASVYLKELKTLAPDLFKTVQGIWKTRVGQYVAAEARVKVEAVNIEETLLLHCDKVKMVMHTAPRVQTPDNTDNTNETQSEDAHQGPSTSNGGSTMMGLAL